VFFGNRWKAFEFPRATAATKIEAIELARITFDADWKPKPEKPVAPPKKSTQAKATTSSANSAPGGFKGMSAFMFGHNAKQSTTVETSPQGIRFFFGLAVWTCRHSYQDPLLLLSNVLLYKTVCSACY
jgi:hypothetical protein